MERVIKMISLCGHCNEPLASREHECARCEEFLCINCAEFEALKREKKREMEEV